MDNQPKKYIISLSQVNPENSILVGERALLLHELEKLNIPIPQSFVLTTSAFDDFVVANDLVMYISSRINDIDYASDRNIKRSANEIQKEIMKSKLPDLIMEPLTRAYDGLGGMFEAFVQLRTSPVYQELNELNYSPTHIIQNIKGIALLAEQIKKLWSLSFTEAALKYRASIAYEGPLTQAIVVQKMVQAEVSGRVYSVSQADNNPDIVEVQAVFGLAEIFSEKGEIADSYFYNKKTEDIVDKKLVNQEMMLVRKGRTADANPNTKVKISSLWNNKQKLEDKYIINLGRIAVSLEGLYEEGVIIEFAYETGKLFITDVTTIKENSRMKLKVLDDFHKRTAQEMFPPKEGLKMDAEAPEGIAIAENNGAIVAENKEVRNAAGIVAETETENTVSDSVVLEGGADAAVQTILLNSHQEDTDGDKAQEQHKEEKLVQQSGNGKEIAFAEEDIVVDVKPITELQQIAKGLSLPGKSNFGLAHFILNESDWLGLTGDEILILQKLNEEKLDIINSSRGLVLIEPLKEEQLQLIKVPVIHSLGDSSQGLRENEVITLNPETGEVLQGAGKVFKQKSVEAETTAQAPANLFQLPKFIENEKTEVETSVDVWQRFNPASPVIEINHIDGVFLNMSDFYLSAGMTPEYILSETTLKQSFAQNVVDVLAPLLTSLERKVLIMQGHDLSYEQMANLKGSDKINFNNKAYSGAGRFVLEPKLMQYELTILDELRNKLALKNIWFAIPKVNNETEQSEIKKIISTFGFRRSSTFKLLSVVASTIGALSVRALAENDIDGIVIDYDAVLSSFAGESAYKNDANLQKFILWLSEAVNSRKCKPYLLMGKEKIDKEMVKQFMENGVNDFITEKEETYQFRLMISHMEIKRIEKKKKRGRKKKEIDYGF